MNIKPNSVFGRSRTHRKVQHPSHLKTASVLRKISVPSVSSCSLLNSYGFSRNDSVQPRMDTARLTPQPKSVAAKERRDRRDGKASLCNTIHKSLRSPRKFPGARVCDPQQPDVASSLQTEPMHPVPPECCGSQSRAPLAAAPPRCVLCVPSRQKFAHAGKTFMDSSTNEREYSQQFQDSCGRQIDSPGSKSVKNPNAVLSDSDSCALAFIRGFLLHSHGFSRLRVCWNQSAKTSVAPPANPGTPCRIRVNPRRCSQSSLGPRLPF